MSSTAIASRSGPTCFSTYQTHIHIGSAGVCRFSRLAGPLLILKCHSRCRHSRDVTTSRVHSSLMGLAAHLFEVGPLEQLHNEVEAAVPRAPVVGVAAHHVRVLHAARRTRLSDLSQNTCG